MNAPRAWPALESAPLVLPGEEYSGAAGKSAHLAALHNALGDVPLGAYDRAIIDWLAESDTPAVATIVSLLHRVREQAPPDTQPRSTEDLPAR